MAHELDLRLLRAFVAVVENGSFSAAASALHLTQPALSRRVRDLEDLLGVSLLDRTTRRVLLSSSGEALLARSRELLAGGQDLQELAQTLKGGRGGILRVGGAPLMLQSVVAPFLARYRARHPDVEVRVHEQGGVQSLEAVVRGDLHLAVATAIEPRLASRPLFPLRALAVVAKTHPLARRKTVEIETLVREPILTVPHVYILRRMFDAACEAAHLRPRIRMESDNSHTLVALARSGYGVAIVTSMSTMDGRGVQAVPVLVQGRSLGRWTSINWDARRFQPAYAQQFVEALVEFTSRDHPGRQYKYAPPIPRPDVSKHAPRDARDPVTPVDA